MCNKTLITPPRSQNNVKRILFVDVAKAICIVLVVIGHYIPDNSPDWYVAVHDIIYTFHMPLFMFASGYVYIATVKDIPYGQFILKKLKRLMVPYFTTSIIVIYIKILTEGSMSVDNPVTAVSYLRMFYYPEAGYFLWFIWALWWMFVIIPLFRTRNARLILFFISLVLHYAPLPLTDVFCLAQFKNMLVFFMLGVIAFEYVKLHSFIKDFNIKQSVVIVSLFVVCQYIRFSVEEQGIITSIIDVLLPYLGILFIVEISKTWCHVAKLDKKSTIMLVAASSYVIYLLHTTFEGFTKAVFRKLPLDTDLWYIFSAEAIVVIAVGVIGPMLCFKVFKKYKLTRRMFGM